MIIDKKCTIKRIISTFFAVLIITFIFLQSMKPASESSVSSGRVVTLLNNIFSTLGMGEPFTQNFVRTCAHFTEFGILGLSLCFMFNTYTEKMKFAFILSFVTSVLVAVFDECIQLFSYGRTFQLKDIIIDTTGALIFIMLTSLLLYKAKRNKSK